MVKVRLARRGAKKRPYYHIVVTDSAKARDGRFIEQIGAYDPARPEEEATIDRERLGYWIGVGAQLSTRVTRVVNKHARAMAAAQASLEQA